MNGQKSNASYYFRICFSLLVIASVMALLLAVFNSLTKDKIEENTRNEINATVKAIFSDYGDSVKTEVPDISPDENSSVEEFYTVKVEDVIIGYVAICEPTGFKDVIKMAVGISENGEVREVKIISLSETPGVGAKVSEEAFLSEFKSEKGALKVDKDGGTIDAISGATISSRAVTLGVNDALEFSEKVIGGQK